MHISDKRWTARLSRRDFLGKSSAAVAAAAVAPIAAAQQQGGSAAPNTNEIGPKNPALEAEQPDSVFPPETDSGGQPPFKYPFAFSRRRIESGGWTRQVTVREFPLSKKMAGVEMRLIRGGVRELHWHVGAEWAFMTAGTARITTVDQKGRGFVEDVSAGDLWLFPGGIPHSIQGVGDDGCQFLLVFNDGNFNEYQTFLLTDWLHHTPREVLAKNFGYRSLPSTRSRRRSYLSSRAIFRARSMRRRIKSQQRQDRSPTALRSSPAGCSPRRCAAAAA